jgi:hypothetical protein
MQDPTRVKTRLGVIRYWLSVNRFGEIKPKFL